jgi:hypothetical protein
MSTEIWGPVSELFKSWKTHMDSLVNNQDPIMKELAAYSQQLTRILKAANRDMSDFAGDLQTITVSITEEGDDKPKYSAELRLDGDWREQLPKPHPEANDVYWLRFQENVNKTRDERKEITNKAIEVAGSSISKVINPISFNAVDVAKLIQVINDVTKK